MGKNEVKKTKSTARKVISVIIDIILVIYLIFSISVAAIAISSSKTDVPSLFGNSFNTIQSGSMEPTFYKGDLLICKTDVDCSQLQVGDVIGFRSVAQDTAGNDVNIIVIHRIFDIKEENGEKFIITKGDNNPVQDENPLKVKDGKCEDIVCRWNKSGEETGTVIKGGGKVVDFLKSSDGILYCLVIPLGIFFLYALFCFVKALVEYRYSKKPQQESELSDEEKEKIAREYLASQQKDTSSDNSEDKTE